MEISQSLAIESFSYSWLLNPIPSLHDLEGISYLEEEHNFNFDTPISQSSFNIALVHYADELFSNGIIKPIDDHVDHSGIGMKSFDTTPRRKMPVSSLSSRSSSFSCSIFLGKLGKISLSKKIMQKCVKLLLKHLGQQVGVSRKSSARVDDIDRREKLKGSRSCVGDYYYLCDHVESPIHDAVLHCKRSIGK